MINLYYMRYGGDYVKSMDSLEEAISDASYQFYEGYSCSQTVIDEDNQKIYTLFGGVTINRDFYKFQHNTYDVINTSCFDDEAEWKLVGIYKVGED